jgi:hypothetical protein
MALHHYSAFAIAPVIPEYAIAQPAISRSALWPFWREAEIGQNDGSAKCPNSGSRGASFDPSYNCCGWRDLFAAFGDRSVERASLASSRGGPQTSKPENDTHRYSRRWRSRSRICSSRIADNRGFGVADAETDRADQAPLGIGLIRSVLISTKVGNRTESPERQ